MFQLRIYTLKDDKTASLYINEYWQRHLISLPKYGIKVEGVFKEKSKSSDQPCRVFAIVSFSKGVDAQASNQKYMDSPEFKSDMDGFPMENILNVESLDLARNEKLPFFDGLEAK